MTSAPTRLQLFVPGMAASEAEWRAALGGAELEVELEFVENDGSFGQAFSFGTVSARQQAAIAAAASAVVLYLPVDLSEGQQALVRVASKLKAAGALALRFESSKLGWAIDRWIELVGSGEPLSLYRAAVVVLADREAGVLHSCGMHAFSLPEAVVPLDAGDDAASAFLTALNLYQLAEAPLLASGHTFAPDAQTPRRVLVRWPDGEYPRGHPCHNPYGVWRVGSLGEKGWPSGEQTIVFMPALAVMLRAAEQQAGHPLTRAEVESLRGKAVCMRMDAAHARALERSRGYADLEPSLAWEQWQAWR